MREAGLARRFRSRQWRAGAAAALAAAFVAASCLVLGQHSRHGGHGSLEQDGRSLAALERQRARLQSFISEQDGSGRPTARSVPEAGEGHTVAAVKATDSTANRMHCGKLCQTRRMILKARGRIDSQAHAELQQLAVKPCLLCVTPVQLCRALSDSNSS